MKSIEKWRGHIVKKHFNECESCEKKFECLRDTRIHFVENHLIRKYVCAVCEYEGDSKKDWALHRCEKCSACNLFFTKCMCENGPAQVYEEYQAWLVDSDSEIMLTDPNPWSVRIFPFLLFSI